MVDRLKRRNVTKSKLMEVVLPRVEELLEGGVPQDEDSILELARYEATAKDLLEGAKILDIFYKLIYIW